MSYKILLFDLDDTLLDFAANEKASLKILFQEHGYSPTDQLLQTYATVNRELWSAYEKGKIALEEVLSKRFANTMLKLGQVIDGRAWEKEYRALLSKGCQLINGALELCESLAKSYRLFIVTNGVTETQLKRLTESGLIKYFEDIFTSQSIGFQKPSKEFFDYVISHIKDFSLEDALIIGDSLSTDIKGGIMAGIDSCWLNSKNQACPAEIQSTYSIISLAELPVICAIKKGE